MTLKPSIPVYLGQIQHDLNHIAAAVPEGTAVSCLIRIASQAVSGALTEILPKASGSVSLSAKVQADPDVLSPLDQENAREALTAAGNMCAAVRTSLRGIGDSRAPEEIAGCAEIVTFIGQRIGEAVNTLGKGEGK